ncbi:MAG TPA: hypothetical protein VKD72_30385 [Gemmataceae bacterium]|nr:hypothetical protein [Gemmataceae bacterium]
MMRLQLDNGIWAIAMLAMLGFTGTAWACEGVCTTPLNFSDNQYDHCFTDVRRGPDINDNGVPDLGGTGNAALNFTGGAGPAGDTWLTKFTPDGSTRICRSPFLQADVLIHTFNNTKGAGVVGLLDSAPGGKGLALILYDQGNSDALQLATIDPATGKLTKLTSVSLDAGIAENTWYRLQMTVGVNGDQVFVTGLVVRHLTPTNPDSGLDGTVGPVLVFQGSLSALGLDSEGEVGIAASAFSTNVNSSVTNFNLPQCLLPPA